METQSVESISLHQPKQFSISHASSSSISEAAARSFWDIRSIFSTLYYVILGHQFLHFALFAGNAGLYFTGWLNFMNYLFPYASIDSFKGPIPPTAFQWSYLLSAFSLDVLLLTLFSLQHSIMARLPFQNFTKKNFSRSVERTSYLVGSILFWQLLYFAWRPMPQFVIWNFSDNLILNNLGWTFFGIGVIGVIWSVLTSWKNDMFGFWSGITGASALPTVPEIFPTLYRYVRQPLFAFSLLAYWSSAYMTLGRFLFASFMTMYTVVGMQFQERDMITKFGAKYLHYMRAVPALVPNFWSSYTNEELKRVVNVKASSA